ncbi:MAG: SPOR domain-containing protein [Desulfobacteraceae bacterium]|nr:MAG: SPOR domain-containing protein [Desulfobacteraceae bacterium]
MARKKSPSAKGNSGKYHLEMSSLSLLFWGFCLCFLLAWVFVLGVLVGRGFLPSAVSTISDLKAQISRLQGIVPHAKTTPPPDTQKIDKDPKLAFYEKLSSKKEEVKKKGPREEKAAKPETAAKGPSGAKEERNSISENGSKTPAEPKASSPAQTADTRQNGKSAGAPAGVMYTVQLASLEDKAKAEGMVGRLKSVGFDAYSYEVKIKGKTFYRIRSGKFKTREEAGIHARKVAEKAGINGIVSKSD